jgi:hypothetical protein
MDPTQQAFLVEAGIYLAAALLIYIAGHTHGSAGKKKAERRAADRAWRISEAMRRHSSGS